MADEKEKTKFLHENSNDESETVGTVKEKKNLKAAAAQLKTEALRRYKAKLAVGDDNVNDDTSGRDVKTSESSSSNLLYDETPKYTKQTLQEKDTLNEPDELILNTNEIACHTNLMSGDEICINLTRCEKVGSLEGDFAAGTAEGVPDNDEKTILTQTTLSPKRVSSEKSIQPADQDEHKTEKLSTNDDIIKHDMLGEKEKEFKHKGKQFSDIEFVSKKKKLTETKSGILCDISSRSSSGSESDSINSDVKMKKIDTDEMKNIDRDKMKKIDTDEMKKLDIDEMKKLDIDKMKKIDTDEIKNIDTDEMKNIDREKMKKIDTEKMKKIDTDEMENIDREKMKKIDTDKMKKTDTDKMKKIDTDEMKKIDPDEMKNIDTDKMKKLDTDKMKKIDTDEMGGMSGKEESDEEDLCNDSRIVFSKDALEYQGSEEYLDKEDDVTSQSQASDDDNDDDDDDDDDENNNRDSQGSYITSSQKDFLTRKDDETNDDQDNRGNFDDSHKQHYGPAVPGDFLSLYHSFGYECQKLSNLHLVSTTHAFFATGNIFEIIDLKTGHQSLTRSMSGKSIGAIAVHPSRKYFAVGEKGIDPNIVLYNYPNLKVRKILRNGTELAYAHLDFSPSGEKLASLGSYPDFMLTIWDWRQEHIILRSKAFAQDVYKVAFSLENEGHLCSSGSGHIKFWTMANTFTGLKLQGDLGRFGTTELSDISGFVEFPDGKVLSGCEWGNMLLWEGGLIKVEITRKSNKPCHHGTIEQFFLYEGELISIGLDGYVKVWDFESIDIADSMDESKTFELEPMSELKVGNEVKLVSMVKSVNLEHSNIWFAQDSSGGIWKLDLSFSHTSYMPAKLFSYHSGAVTALIMSPVSHVAITTGKDGTVRLYDYLCKRPVCEKKFNSAGCSAVWLPKVLDLEACSVLVGFNDGVVRHLSIAENENLRQKDTITLHLIQVFKPHLKKVTCMAIDSQGKYLATGSDDQSVFFFTFEEKFSPLGFVEVDTEVVSIQWSYITMGTKLLVGGKDGVVLELLPPQPAACDVSKTFKLSLNGILTNKFMFVTVKDDILRAKKEAQKAKELEEKMRLKKEEEERRKAENLEEETDEDEESENSDDEDEDDIVVHHEQGCLLKAFYRKGSNNFFITMDGWDAGYFYECTFPTSSTQPVKECIHAIEIPEIDSVPVTSIQTSHNGDFLLLGQQDGTLRIQNMNACTFDNLTSYWLLHMHDNQHGGLTNVVTSYDDKFLMSAGQDGNVFVYSFLNEELSEELKAMFLKTSQRKHFQVDDIKDHSHYSIEVEKQKAEHDRLMQMAQKKKEKIRNTITNLQKEFRKLKATNKQLPPYLQLSPDEFIIDPNLKKIEDEKTEMQIDLLNRETAWEAEKHRIGLEKLQKRFKAVIDCERMVLRSFLSGHSVSTYRLAKLTEEFYGCMIESKRRATISQELQTNQSRRISVMRGGKTGHEQDRSPIKEFVSKPLPVQKLNKKIAKVIEKAEQRKQKRLNRQKEWEEFYKTKPDENHENAEDIEAIRTAEQTIGDFKLKTAADFVVPENQRVNAEKKKFQLLSLKEQVHQKKKAFNKRVLTLRDKKQEIIQQVKDLIAELEEVQSKLPDKMQIPDMPDMQPEEIPEKRFEYTTAQLLKFRVEVLGLDALGSSAIDNRFGEDLPARAHPSNLTDNRVAASSIYSTFSSIPQSSSSIQWNTADVTLEDRSSLEIAIEREQIMRLSYRRDELQREIREKFALFDEHLFALRKEKIFLDVQLKKADLRSITFFEELVLLKDFEKRENELAMRVLLKMQMKEDMEENVHENRILLAEKGKEMCNFQERERALLASFCNIVGDNNKFEGFLTKVFKKKIKRVKKKLNEDGISEDEGSDDEDSDSDVYDSDEEDSDDELDDSICPHGCDQLIFDQVCQLRERKLDLEELLVESKRQCDAARKALDALVKRNKVMESALENAKADLELFQREKQQKLNELDVVVTLRLSQIQYSVNNTMPCDLAPCLVFDQANLNNLQSRIKELIGEKGEQKQLYRKRRQQHVQMKRDKKAMQGKICELEDKVRQMQMLKFGRLIDLEKLETVSVNRVAEELKEKLKEQKKKNSKEIGDWDKNIDSLQTEFTKVVRENTKRVEAFTYLHQEHKMLEQKLNTKHKSLGGEFHGNIRADEPERLVRLVHSQSQDINVLKEEIELLSRKGGHILPPTSLL